jgi:hypothetical protein
MPLRSHVARIGATQKPPIPSRTLGHPQPSPSIGHEAEPHRVNLPHGVSLTRTSTARARHRFVNRLPKITVRIGNSLGGFPSSQSKIGGGMLRYPTMATAPGSDEAKLSPPQCPRCGNCSRTTPRARKWTGMGSPNESTSICASRTGFIRSASARARHTDSDAWKPNP